MADECGTESRVSQKPPVSPPKCQLFVVTEPLSPHAPNLAALSALFSSVPIACLLLRFATRETRFAEPIVTLAQQHGLAVLVEDDTRLMGQLKADGVHLNGALPQSLETLQSLPQNRTINIGVGNCTTRHDLMEYAEAGADYVFFGQMQGQEKSQDALLETQSVAEQLSWWAPIFITPCVALAKNLDEIQIFKDLSADFVALEISLEIPSKVSPQIPLDDAHNNAMIYLHRAHHILTTPSL